MKNPPDCFIKFHEQDAKKILKFLERKISFNNCYSKELVEAIRYVLFSQGKMVRSFLLKASYNIFNKREIVILEAASAIEVIHSYTLVHDDLPIIDDDDYRRGIPSCHKKYGEDIALLTGDALLTLGFEILANSKYLPDNIKIRIIQRLAELIGYNGVVAGQVMDIKNTTKNNTIRTLKTSNLFIASCASAAIAADADNQDIIFLERYAKNFGLAYQILDDISDGEISCSKYLKLLVKDSLSSLDVFGDKSKDLRDFTAWYFREFI